MATLQAALLTARKGPARLLAAGTNAAGAFNEDDRRCVVAASGVTGAPLVKSFSSPAATEAHRRPSVPRSSAAPAAAGAADRLWHLGTGGRRAAPEAAGRGPALGAAEPSTQHGGDAGPAADGLAGPADHLAPYQECAWPMVQVPPHCVVFPTFFMPIVVHAPAAVASAASCGEAEHALEQQYVQPGQQMVLLPHQVAQSSDVAGEALAPAAAGFPVQAAPAHAGRTGASRRQRRRLLRANAAAEQHRPPQQQPCHGGGLRPAAQAAVSKLVLGGGPTAPGASVGAVRPAALAARPDVLEPEPEAPVLWPPTPESTPPGSPRAAEAAPQAWQGMLPAWQVAAEEAPSVDFSPPPLDGEKATEYGHLLQQLGDASRLPALVEWVTAAAWPLASSPGGCRVVQGALEAADGPQRLAIAEQLHGHVWEASLSPHANHVLQKCVEVLPPDRVDFVLSEMRGHAIAAARHRYGCRVLERIVEHCPPEQTEELVSEVLSGAAQLCRHTFGNFVIQHILEHGTPAQRHGVAEVLHADIQRLARHRVASYVVRSALVHCTPEDRNWLVQTMKADAVELQDLTHHHCGSFVVREMRRGERNVEATVATA